ncbi:MAG: TIGR03032 family protein [Bacteroidota bacterium]
MTEPSPFSCVATPDFVRLLHELRSSIVISTYQAGKVIFLSAKNEHELIQFPRSFRKAMGIALSDQRLAIATHNEVVVYSNSPGQARSYPKKPNLYDTLYIPRAKYYTGELDIHDIHFTNNGLLAVNTRFSCVSTIDDNYSFKEVWRPSFITDLQPGDHCHLNGMVVVNDKPKYLTALGTTNSPKGWRPTKASGGILIDADSQEFVLTGLPMPHSPRLYKEGLFVLLSATGELARVDIEKHSYEVIYRFNGFVRGMDRIGDFLFIGLSRLRTTSVAFGDLPIAAQSPVCGVAVFHLPSGKFIAQLKYEASVEEIYEVRVLENSIRPSIMSIEKNDHEGVITVPEGVFWPIPTPKS